MFRPDCRSCTRSPTAIKNAAVTEKLGEGPLHCASAPHFLLHVSYSLRRAIAAAAEGQRGHVLGGLIMYASFIPPFVFRSFRSSVTSMIITFVYVQSTMSMQCPLKNLRRAFIMLFNYSRIPSRFSVILSSFGLSFSRAGVQVNQV